MTLAIILIALAAFIGTVVQTVTGLGLLLFLTPVLLIFLEPRAAITTALISGTIICLFVLFGEQRKTETLTRYLPHIILAAIPGILLGTYVLTGVTKAHLLIIVGAVIIAASLLQQLSFSKPNLKYKSRRWAILASFVAGISNASTSIGGPFLVLWLRSFSDKIHEVRDTLSVSFIFLNLTSFISISVARPDSLNSQSLLIIILLVPIIFLGHKAGRKVLKKINISHFRLYVLLAVLAAGVVSLVSGITKL
jgi:hypothetical protein